MISVALTTHTNDTNASTLPLRIAIPPSVRFTRYDRASGRASARRDQRQQSGRSGAPAAVADLARLGHGHRMRRLHLLAPEGALEPLGRIVEHDEEHGHDQQ